MQKEERQDQQRQLQAALNRIRADFGRRRRTFRAALLRNPPAIPLWGVMSSHPDTVCFNTWGPQQVHGVIPDEMWPRLQQGERDGCIAITCQRHTDVLDIVKSVPVGECTVQWMRAAKLVAEPANKLAGIDYHFGTNAVGDLPRCTKHMETERLDILCLAGCTDEQRELQWWCNECRGTCDIEAPKLEAAADFMPDSVFDRHNTIPADYLTHLQDRLEREDLDFMIRTLPLRRAPGPDGIPNEVL